MTYNYLESMKEDIRQWLEDNDWKDNYEDYEEGEENA